MCIRDRYNDVYGAMKVLKLVKALLVAMAALAAADCALTLALDSAGAGYEANPLLQAPDGTADPVKVVVVRGAAVALGLASAVAVARLEAYPRLLKALCAAVGIAVAINAVTVVNNLYGLMLVMGWVR